MRRKGTAALQARQIDGNSLSYLFVEPDDYDDTLEYPTVVLLHGYGASMSDLAGLAPAIDRTGYVYLFPNAPIPMQIGIGMTGYAWTPPGGDGTDHATERAEDLLAGFFDEVMERHGITEGGMVMGGFSQGGMMTYRFGLPRPEMFAGADDTQRTRSFAGRAFCESAGAQRSAHIRRPRHQGLHDQCCRRAEVPGVSGICGIRSKIS